MYESLRQNSHGRVQIPRICIENRHLALHRLNNTRMRMPDMSYIVSCIKILSPMFVYKKTSTTLIFVRFWKRKNTLRIVSSAGKIFFEIHNPTSTIKRGPEFSYDMLRLFEKIRFRNARITSFERIVMLRFFSLLLFVK